MNGGARLGLCVLCVLMLGALSAANATAASKGTTAFTCKEVAAGKGHFVKSHCKSSDAGTGNFDHVAFAVNQTTELSISNETTGGEKSPMILKATGPGGSFEMQAKTVTGTGWIENRIVGEEHQVVGEMTLFLSEVVVAKPAGCTVRTDEGEPGKEGTLDTKPLAITTSGQGDFLKFAPVAEEIFSTFIIEGGCSLKNQTLTIKGSVKNAPDGSTVNFVHVDITEQNTLSLANLALKEGIAGSLTFKGRTPGVDPSFTPLAFTTVETP